MGLGFELRAKVRSIAPDLPRVFQNALSELSGASQVLEIA